MKSIQHWCSHSGLKLQERWGYWEVALLVLDKLHCSCSIWVHLLMCMPWFWPRLDHVAAILDMGEGVCVCASKLVFFPALELLIWGWFREDFFFSAHHIECNYCLEIEGVSWNQTGNVAACPVFFFLLVVGAGCAPPSCLDSMGGGQVAADEAQCLGRASKPAGRWEGWELQEPVAWQREALYSLMGACTLLRWSGPKWGSALMCMGGCGNCAWTMFDSCLVAKSSLVAKTCSKACFCLELKRFLFWGGGSIPTKARAGSAQRCGRGEFSHICVGCFCRCCFACITPTDSWWFFSSSVLFLLHRCHS